MLDKLLNDPKVIELIILHYSYSLLQQLFVTTIICYNFSPPLGSIQIIKNNMSVKDHFNRCLNKFNSLDAKSKSAEEYIKSLEDISSDLEEHMRSDSMSDHWYIKYNLLDQEILQLLDDIDSNRVDMNMMYENDDI